MSGGAKDGIRNRSRGEGPWLVDECRWNGSAVTSHADPDLALNGVMTEYCRRVLAGDERTYDLCMDAGGALMAADLVLDASHGGAAYCLWMDASDIYDAPRRPDVALLERERQLQDHARSFAADWVTLDPTSTAAVAAFFARWVT
jgi:hypothetical protein